MNTPFRVETPLGWIVEAALGLKQLEQLYGQCDSGDFISESLRVLGVQVDLQGNHEAIPARGPLVVVANHPTGALDGLAMIDAIRRRRPDVKLLANHVLLRIPEIREHVIAVNPFTRNPWQQFRGLREACRWLRRGGALIVFPAGSVSSVPTRDGHVDSEWRKGVLKMIRWSGANVVPAFIEAANRRSFYLAGRVHPLLRTLLLGRELLAKRGSSIRIRIGEAIDHEQSYDFADPCGRIQHLRTAVYALGKEEVGAPKVHAERPIASEEAPEVLSAEVGSLPRESLLLSTGPYAVYCAGARQMPAVLREIGRLRELTFRLVGEGTGGDRDLDRFDEAYEHLFVWHAERRCVVGAYRIGRTDHLCPAAEPRALYTRTLFRYGPEFLRAIGPALELGRSFVRPEFQRESNVLFLLWRGIGTLVAREPRYRVLFGAVSISAAYRSFTRRLIADALTNGGFASPLAGFVQPVHPLPRAHSEAAPLTQPATRTLDELEHAVKGLEGGRGMPVLLRQYLKLDAQVAGFSVDPSFGNVLDGLILVDLLRVQPSRLNRFIGTENAAAFRGHHQHPSIQTAA